MLPKIAESDGITTVAGSHLRGFRGVAGESRLRPRLVPANCTTRYYMRCRTDGYVTALVVQNPVGHLVCFSTTASGGHCVWDHREIGPDLLEFFAHPEYHHVHTCKVCEGSGVIGVDPETNPFGSKCGSCEGSGEIPAPVCLVTEKHVVAERIYLDPTTAFFFPEPPSKR